MVNDGETPCEATVLDCGPLDKATIPAWSTAEVAQVLPTRTVSVSIEDEEQKVIPCTDNLEEIQGTVTTIGNRAEILKISEEFHNIETIDSYSKNYQSRFHLILNISVLAVNMM